MLPIEGYIIRCYKYQAAAATELFCASDLEFFMVERTTPRVSNGQTRSAEDAHQEAQVEVNTGRILHDSRQQTNENWVSLVEFDRRRMLTKEPKLR